MRLTSNFLKFIGVACLAIFAAINLFNYLLGGSIFRSNPVVVKNEAKASHHSILLDRNLLRLYEEHPHFHHKHNKSSVGEVIIKANALEAHAAGIHPNHHHHHHSNSTNPLEKHEDNLESAIEDFEGIAETLRSSTKNEKNSTENAKSSNATSRQNYTEDELFWNSEHVLRFMNLLNATATSQQFERIQTNSQNHTNSSNIVLSKRNWVRNSHAKPQLTTIVEE